MSLYRNIEAGAPRRPAGPLRRLLRTRYRLSVLHRGDGRYRSTYGLDGRLLRRMAENMDDAEQWTLYKTGPFLLPERPVAEGEGRAR